MDEESKAFVRSLMGEVTGDITKSVTAIGDKVDSLASWRPELEARVQELQAAVGELQKAALVKQPHITIDTPPAPGTAPHGAARAASAGILGAAQLVASPGQSVHGFVSGHTLPVFYENYHDQVDEVLYSMHGLIGCQYQKLDKGVLSKIPEGSLKFKKSQ